MSSKFEALQTRPSSGHVLHPLTQQQPHASQTRARQTPPQALRHPVVPEVRNHRTHSAAIDAWAPSGSGSNSRLHLCACNGSYFSRSCLALTILAQHSSVWAVAVFPCTAISEHAVTSNSHTTLAQVRPRDTAPTWCPRKRESSRMHGLTSLCSIGALPVQTAKGSPTIDTPSTLCPHPSSAHGAQGTGQHKVSAAYHFQVAQLLPGGG